MTMRKTAFPAAFRWFGLAAVLALVATGSVAAEDRAAKDRMEKNLSFQAGSIVLADLPAEVAVEVGTKPGITVRLVGTSEQVDAVRATVESGVLTLKAKPGAAGGNVSSSVVTGNGNSVSVITTGGTLPVVTVAVPRGTPATVRGAAGHTVLGDLDAPITVSLGSGAVEIGQARGATLEIPGSGRIVADRVAGNLALAIKGSGTIQVAAATVEELNATLSGSGMIQVDGRARRASLPLTGAGTITVAEVAERPDVRVAGAGFVKVGNW
jgi:hypothetical protein